AQARRPARRRPRGLRRGGLKPLLTDRSRAREPIGKRRIMEAPQWKERSMRKLIIAAASTFAIAGLAACNSPADNAAEQQADALEAEAAATSNEARETQLNQQADMIEQQAGNADGGMTTENTPSTSPS